MTYFDMIYSASPVMAMSPQPIHQSYFSKHVQPQRAASFNQPVSWARPVAGRKRSRDEAAVNLDSPEKVVEPPVFEEPEDEWIYGPGMTLIKKSSGYVADASSQSGTWVEEKKADDDARKADEALLIQQQASQERPSLRGRKSQRLTIIAPVSGASTSKQHIPSGPSHDAVSTPSASSDSLAQPIVDDFTVHLGIGWNRIGQDEPLQAAARGWARYIENHFPVTNVMIRVESRGLQSYLIEAAEGYYLFAENLRHGRLISKDAERTLQNLKSSPIVFDGADTMEASGMASPPVSVDMDMN